MPRLRWCIRLLTLGSALLQAAAVQAQPDVVQGAAPACRQLVASGNPQYPPYLWRSTESSERLVGANVEMLTWLSKEVGVPIEARYVGPWARVQEEMRAGRIDLIAGAFFTLARTEYMDYFHPAFRETRSVVLVRSGSNLDYRRWSDLAPLQGGTVIGNSFGEEFDRYAKENLQLTQVSGLAQALQMLQRSRIDYLIYEDSPALAYVARLNMQNVRPLRPAVASESLYLTLSHRSPCNTPELRGRLARAMYALSRQGLMNGWIDSNIQVWKRIGPAP
ncbi:transporter substrate-binding domain-containing protein [Roseateles asaccharophilus]|uniref:Polar amino acid transport system substrate-binding protein n=1 Tax=Roseateles asaccharophilus TaxID=582607 RepID=A0ABU2A7K2_9BURK|nr:transporter substrate-binding domain-containing protein [Roseateles asaccharophilus]MDR7332472.1 polar amino acid transport system substrate-binding protein [Roseateles asaccharophilus]